MVCSPAFALEQIETFVEEKDGEETLVEDKTEEAVTQVNENFRLLHEDTKTNTSDITTNTASIAAITHPVVQVVNVQDGAYAAHDQTGGAGKLFIPYDASIPQITEGSEVMTLAITPTSATNKLIIQVTVAGTCDGVNNPLQAALFNTDTHATNALKAAAAATDANKLDTVTFTHYMTAPGTSAYTFRVRAGGSENGTFYFNGASAAVIYGGVAASSITIMEVEP